MPHDDSRTAARRRSGRGRLAAATATASACVLLAALPACAAAEGYLRYRMPGDPPTLDPIATPDENSGLYIFNLFDGLVEFAPGSVAVVPAVAESWTVSPDGRTYTFKIRDGVRFHDGTAVTARDVVYSIARGLDPGAGSGVAGLLEPIEGSAAAIKGGAGSVSGLLAPDARTVVITLARPYGPFLATLASQAGSIVPEKVYSDPNHDPKQRPVGCGPFSLESWDKGVGIRLRAFPGHWKGAPGIAGVEVRFIPTAATAFEEFKRGTLDFLNEAPRGQRAKVREERPDEYRTWSRMAGAYVFFNHAAGPFKGNATLRKAIAMAIDRDRVARVFQEGKDEAATRIIPPGLIGHDPSPGPFRYDPAEAKRLLAEAGYPEGKGLPELRFLTAPNEAIRRYTEGILADLAAIGIRARIKDPEFGSYIADLVGKPETGPNGDLFNLLWYPDLPDPDGYIRILLHSSNFGVAGNFSRYSNPQVDRLLDEARYESDPAKREALYRKAESAALEDVACAPVYFQHDDALVARRVGGLVLPPLGDFAAHLELVRLGPE